MRSEYIACKRHGRGTQWSLVGAGGNGVYKARVQFNDAGRFRNKYGTGDCAPGLFSLIFYAHFSFIFAISPPFGQKWDQKWAQKWLLWTGRLANSEKGEQKGNFPEHLYPVKYLLVGRSTWSVQRVLRNIGTMSSNNNQVQKRNLSEKGEIKGAQKWALFAKWTHVAHFEKGPFLASFLCSSLRPISKRRRKMKWKMKQKWAKNGYCEQPYI